MNEIPSDPKAVTSWKDHPLVIAALAAVSTLTVVIFVFKEVVIPTQTASLHNEIASLNKQVDPLRDETRALRKKLEEREAELNTTKGKLMEAQLANVFSFGNPYPTGLGLVRLGDSIETISKFYPEASIRKLRYFWSVTSQHPAFNAVTYYFEQQLRDRRIVQILFHFDRGLFAPADPLQTKLVEALGQPTFVGPKQDCYIWKVDQKLFALKDSPNSLLVKLSAPSCEIERQ